MLLERSQVFAPSCGEGFIYDRVLGACSNNRLVEIKGIHLGAETWKPAYGNTSSEEFKIMAAEKEYQLFVLMKVGCGCVQSFSMGNQKFQGYKEGAYKGRQMIAVLSIPH